MTLAVNQARGDTQLDRGARRVNYSPSATTVLKACVVPPLWSANWSGTAEGAQVAIFYQTP